MLIEYAKEKKIQYKSEQLVMHVQIPPGSIQTRGGGKQKDISQSSKPEIH